MKTITRRYLILCCLALVALVGSVYTVPATAATVGTSASGSQLAAADFPVGFVFVGPQDDAGWSQAHFEASQYLKDKVPGVRPVILDNLNSAVRPNVTLDQVVENMKSEGVKLIFTTSDAFQDDTTAAAKKYPDITFINVSGDAVLKGDAPKNLGNVMGRMEFTKMIGGCAAALATQKNSIGYLGPLINDETRRLASSAFLGAQYCFSKYRKLDPTKLQFQVIWIGNWFNIPGVTLNPTEVANQFYDSGVDVVMSGIDTPDAIAVAKQRSDKGENVFAVPYDFKGACTFGPKVCLGVPYFNWGPAYVKIVTDFRAGNWKQSWDWNGPDWKDINNPDTSAVGFVKGDGLTKDQQATLDSFIKELADGLILFKGPLNYQDGSVYLKQDEVATDNQVWYLKQLLAGMKGDSEPKKT